MVIYMANTVKNKFKTEWTGKEPRLYLGEWKLYKNGNDISFMIPTEQRIIPAFTFGEYGVWEEQPFVYVHQYVTDGYRIPEWIQRNQEWLKLIVDTDMDYEYIYNAFHKNDFRTSRYM